MRRLYRIAAPGLLATVLLLTACGGSQTEPEQQTAPARTVTVHTLRPEVRHETVMVSGRVEHADEAMLAFRTGGIIANVAVDEGDRFQRGDRLASLNTTEVEAMVADATELREQAERTVRRMERLYDDNAVALQALQDARTALERAEAGERRARFVLANATLVAPYDGFVAMRLAHPGEMIAEGAPVLRVVADGEQRRVRVGIPSRLLAWMKVGDEARVTVETIPSELMATVLRVGAVAERTTGNFIVELALPAHDWLREGLVATVTLSGPPQPVHALPGGALAGGDVDRGVFFVFADDHAQRRELRILEMTGDSIYVEPNLPDGTPVIVDGAGFLRDGDSVILAEAGQ